MLPPGDLPSWARRLRRFDLPRDWGDRIRELVDLVQTVAMPKPPAAPGPVMPTSVASLDDQLADAARRSPREVEALGRGALLAGHGHDALVAWALARCNDPAAGEMAAAAACAVIRERGYQALLALPDGDPSLPPVITVPGFPGVDPDLFAVPRGPFLLALGTRRRFLHDYPYLRQTLASQSPLDHATLFRPEAVLALAQEQSFLSMLVQASVDEFENDILPMSRVPGLNVLVLAGLLIAELPKLMEAARWIGADINNLPRTPMADRPERILPLDQPGTLVNGRRAKYMIFSDVHRDAPQDLAFRIGHFSYNQDLFLRALDYCDDNGYTVLELGDCEELWYEPTFDPAQRQSKLDRLKAIVKLHQPVYAKLAALAADGRYHRCIGNHDSYLWQDPKVVAWRKANPFPELFGGFIIRKVKTMDDFLPHIGLDPDNYSWRADMLLMHGHQFDFWNCDEHNRLGKFITNAVGVPPDHADDFLYDFRGIDRFGHPLVEFWDVLAPLDPFNNWPPREVARQWTERIENRPFVENLTVDSFIFLESVAALYGYLMRSGPPSLANFSVLLCIGHTHNPQCRPWIPFFERFNPWHDDELFGIPVFQNLFALKSRYMSSGPVGWWQDIIWMIEITEEGQPRMAYMSTEDDRPVYMDWELQDTAPLPASPLASLQALVAYFEREIQEGLEAAQRTYDAGAVALPVLRDGRGIVQLEAVPAPDVSTLAGLLTGVARRGGGPVRPALPLVSASAMAAIAHAGPGSDLATAGLLLAARHDPVFAGVRPAPGGQPRSGSDGIGLPSIGTAVIHDLMPRLLTGCPPAEVVPRLDLGAFLSGLLWSRARQPLPLGQPGRRPGPRNGAAAGGSGLRIRVPGQEVSTTAGARSG
jgi:hypothetical protein